MYRCACFRKLNQYYSGYNKGSDTFAPLDLFLSFLPHLGRGHPLVAFRWMMQRNKFFLRMCASENISALHSYLMDDLSIDFQVLEFSLWTWRPRDLSLVSLVRRLVPFWFWIPCTGPAPCSLTFFASIWDLLFFPGVLKVDYSVPSWICYYPLC